MYPVRVHAIFQHLHITRTTSFVVLDPLVKIGRNEVLSLDILAPNEDRWIHPLGFLFDSVPVHLVPAGSEGQAFLRFDHNCNDVRSSKRRRGELVETLDVLADQWFYENPWWIRFH